MVYAIHICMKLFKFVFTVLPYKKCHICSVNIEKVCQSRFVCYPGEALEGPISKGVCKNSTMLIQITTCGFEKLVCYIYTWMRTTMAPTYESIFIWNIDCLNICQCSK